MALRLRSVARPGIGSGRFRSSENGAGSRCDALVARLRALARPDQLAGMARYGIRTDRALGGIGIPALRRIARETGRDPALARALWDTGIHEARILSAYVDDPASLPAAEMDRRARGFESWDVCDQVCGNLFDRTPHAWRKAVQWSRAKAEFVRRAGFSMMAGLAVHDKRSPDRDFLGFLPLIRTAAGDDRNFVKKAVNWALRQIGKRSPLLHAPALALARELSAAPSRSARWIGRDAEKELRKYAPCPGGEKECWSGGVREY